jgi:glutamate formiminotransferase
VVLPGATFAQGRELARLIRESSGGLPGVQALAFDLGNGDMQLSMNLVKLAETSPNRALQQVHSLAAQLGIKVGPDEVVGLCPAAVANHAAKGRILEIRIAASAIGSCLRAAPDDESWLMLDYAAGQLAAAV